MTNQHPRLARLFAAGALTLTLLSAGCSVAVTTGSPSDPPAQSQPAGTPSSASSPSEDAVPAGAVAVDTLVARSTRPADRASTTVKGDAGSTRYDNALSLWAGCEGTPDEVVFGIAGHQIFQGKLGLRTSVPDDIVIEVLILADDEAVQNIQLDGTNPTPALVPIRFLIKDAKTVTTRTKVVRGTCSESADSYAVLVDGYVS
jgi:hypothetical protein